MAALKKHRRVLEREAGDLEMDPIPADNSQPSLNPPPFRWLQHSGVQQWRVILKGPSGAHLKFSPVKEPILALPRTLSPGEWRWQYEGLDETGAPVGRGRERAFELRPGLPGFCLPDVERLKARWRDLQPRIFGKRIAFVRRHRASFSSALRQLAGWCRLAEREPLPKEPAPYRLFSHDTPEWNQDWIRIFSVAKIAAAHAVRFALSFLLTGNKRHLELAKRHALNLVNFNPWGPTSMHCTDEAAMPMLERLSLVYDWLRPHWTDAERSRFLQCMLLRGEEAMERNRPMHFAAKPFYNHQCRTIAFQGFAGIAFLGEIPQAACWLEEVLQTLAVSYPSNSFGSDDGGWAQGLSYWAAYMSWLVHFVAAAEELNINLAAAPYYANMGYYSLYNLPAYAQRGGFGDHSEGGPQILHKLVVGAMAGMAGDGYLKAYADSIAAPWCSPAEMLASSNIDATRRWDAWAMPEVQWLLFMPGSGLASKDISSLPPARHFPYIGWAAMHSALGDAKNDVWLQFKSSRFGSFSHSHADQNSFNLFAYGDSLLIDSGYYPWYGSPHDVLWTRQTWAHNSVLIDGHGQPVFDWFARGKLEDFFEAAPFCYARGEAAEAYNREPERDATYVAQKYHPELLAKMRPAAKVKRAGRAVLMVNGEHPFFVIADDLEVSRPVAFQWLAHALARMKIYRAAKGFDVVGKTARLRVRFAWPGKLEFSQHKRFPIAPEGRAKGSPDQWHLQAATPQRAKLGRFLAVLAPYHAGSRPPEVRCFEKNGVLGVRVGSDLVLAPRSGGPGPIRFAALDAHAALVGFCGGKVFAAEAARLKIGARVLLDSGGRRNFGPANAPAPK